jgi:hypothetical protein
MSVPAKIQERALAEAIRDSAEFRDWFLSRTKFTGLSVEPVLVRSNNPWYASPVTGRQSETDVLAVFRVANTRLRFALHIENKTPKDRFQPDQPELYHERAKDWMLTEKWGMYSDYECILIATAEFVTKFESDAKKFDRILLTSEIAEYLEEFRPVASSL